MDFDPEREITVCCGATEGMIAAMLAVIDPGDEVVVFEPFYENYNPDTQLSGATVRYVTLRAPIGASTATNCGAPSTTAPKPSSSIRPNNPTGKVFNREELEFIAGLCQEFDALAITDEIYEHILYDGAVHTPDYFAAGHARTLDSGQQHEQDLFGHRLARRLGAGAADLTDSIRKVHDFITVGAASPLQQAGVMALGMADDYYATRHRIRGQARPSGGFPRSRRIALLYSTRSVLYYGGHFKLEFP